MAYLSVRHDNPARRWGAVPWLLLAALVAVGIPMLRTARTGDQATMEHYRALLARQAGPDAVDCGDTVLLKQAGSLRRNACLDEALAAGTPFMASFAWDPSGHNHYEWWGFAHDGKRGHWQVRYTADVYSGIRDTAVPELELIRCGSLQIPELFDDAWGFCQPLDRPD